MCFEEHHTVFSGEIYRIANKIYDKKIFKEHKSGNDDAK